MSAKGSRDRRGRCKLKKGDEVIVLTGRLRKRTGKVDRIDRKHNAVYLQGMNLRKKHARPNMQNQEGGIIDIVVPLPISNVAIVDPQTKKRSRIGYSMSGGTKTRIAKKSKALLN